MSKLLIKHSLEAYQALPEYQRLVKLAQDFAEFFVGVSELHFIEFEEFSTVQFLGNATSELAELFPEQFTEVYVSLSCAMDAFNQAVIR